MLEKYVDAPLLDIPGQPLINRSALITGATRMNGIGFGIAERFAACGASHIILVGTASSEDIAPLAVARLRRYGVDAHALTGDVTDILSCAAIIKRSYEICEGNVGILVNNAGVNVNKPTPDITLKDWHRVMDVKVLGTFLMIREWFRTRDRANTRGGAVVNIGSVAEKGNYGQMPYVAANGALVSLTRGFALELGRRGINVNLVAPTFIEGTEIARDVTPEQMEFVRSATPLKSSRQRENIVATVQDVAGAVAFLVSPDAAIISGQVIYVDGALGTNFTAMDGLYRDGYRKPQAGGVS